MSRIEASGRDVGSTAGSSRSRLRDPRRHRATGCQCCLSVTWRAPGTRRRGPGSIRRPHRTAGTMRAVPGRRDRQHAADPPGRRRLGTVARRAGNRAAAGDGNAQRCLGRLGRRRRGVPSDAARPGDQAAAHQPVRRAGPPVLSRVRQRDAVAAAARRDREAAVRARLVAQLPRRQCHFRRRGARGSQRATGRAGMGSRLPPDARAPG